MVNIKLIKSVLLVLITITIIIVLKVFGLFDRSPSSSESTLQQLADAFYNECIKYPSLTDFLNNSFVLYANQLSGFIVTNLQVYVIQIIRQKYHIPVGNNLTPEQQQEAQNMTNQILLTQVQPCVVNPLVLKYQTCDNVHNNFDAFLTDFVALTKTCIDKVINQSSN